MPVPLYMNHNVPQAITEGLRLRGVVVTTAFEDGTHQLDDPALLDRAGAIQRPLFTMDRDLLHEASRRQRAEIPFAGVIYGGRAFPDVEPLVCEIGDRVRIRLGNLSQMSHHPIHIHGHQMTVVATDGGVIPPSARWPETTVLVPVGSARDVDFLADNPGDWPLHCHMVHHMMNQMGHDLPNMLGVRVPAELEAKIRRLLPAYMTMGQAGMGEMATMHDMPVPENSIPMRGLDGPFGPTVFGGMATVIKVRDRARGTADPGWYDHPPGTVAAPATAAELDRDGIEPPAPADEPGPWTTGGGHGGHGAGQHGAGGHGGEEEP